MQRFHDEHDQEQTATPHEKGADGASSNLEVAQSQASSNLEVAQSHAPASARRLRLKGIVLLLGSMLIVPFMDAAAKVLVTHGHPLLQVVWLRMIMQVMAVMPFAVHKYGARMVFIRISRRHLLLGRGALLLGATIGFFGAIQFMPLADTVAITFLEPCILMIFARAVLKERVSCDKWVASIVGFGAVLLIVKPASTTFQPASLLALTCAGFFAAYLMATKYLLSKPNPPPPLVLLGYQGIVGAVGLAPILPWVWAPFASWWHLVCGVSMGCIGACSHGLLILAFDAADAAVLSPLLYTEIIMQTVLGLVCFGDWPDTLSAVGIAGIIAVGLYISAEPSVRKRPPSASVDDKASSAIGAKKLRGDTEVGAAGSEGVAVASVSIPMDTCPEGG